VTPRQPADEREEHLRAPADLLTWSRRTRLIDAPTALALGAAWEAAPASGRRSLAAVTEVREAAMR
jgi:hypothetical protein